MSQPLFGKTALVTGGSRGIGRSIAERLAQEGATVALTYNSSKTAAAEVVETIKSAGGSAFALHADLANVEAIRPSLNSSTGSSLNETAAKRWTFSSTMRGIPVGAVCGM